MPNKIHKTLKNFIFWHFLAWRTNRRPDESQLFCWADESWLFGWADESPSGRIGMAPAKRHIIICD